MVVAKHLHDLDGFVPCIVIWILINVIDTKRQLEVGHFQYLDWRQVHIGATVVIVFRTVAGFIPARLGRISTGFVTALKLFAVVVTAAGHRELELEAAFLARLHVEGAEGVSHRFCLFVFCFCRHIPLAYVLSAFQADLCRLAVPRRRVLYVFARIGQHQVEPNPGRAADGISGFVLRIELPYEFWGIKNARRDAHVGIPNHGWALRDGGSFLV